jgi:hypothetical protein
LQYDPFRLHWNRRGTAEMKKALLVSVLLAAVIIPIQAAKLKNPRVGLKRMIVQVMIFNLFYVFAVLFVWGRL